MSIKVFGQSFLSLTVVVAGLGYLIDMFDFFLFNMVRVKSLTELGLSGDALTNAGLLIVNCQFAGLIIGAYVFGSLGDRIGRKKSLIGSIILYSIAVFCTGFVQTPEQYAALRFLSGLGLAGEMGSGLALIAEKYKDERRGYGISAFIILGFVGVVLAAIAANYLPWRVCYMMGGAAGLVILAGRTFIKESELFASMRVDAIARGGLLHLFRKPALLLKFTACILVTVTCVFIPQILWTLSPEIARNMGLTDPVQPQVILGLGYTCVILGDLLAAWLSEFFRSRKKVIAIFMLFGIAAYMALIYYPIESLTSFYLINMALGLAFGAMIVTMTLVTEQFGTNYRATIATTVPNFARGCTILMNFALVPLKAYGLLNAVIIVGSVVFILAILSWFALQETYGRDLNYYD